MTDTPTDPRCAAIATRLEPHGCLGEDSTSYAATRWQGLHLGAAHGITEERSATLDWIDGKIRACERAAADAPASSSEAIGYQVTLHRFTALREEIASGLHVPAQPFGEPKP